MNTTITLDGCEHRCAAFTLREYQELERRYAASRRDPLACARAQHSAFDEASRRRLLELAFEATLRPASPTVDELRCWLLSLDGLSAALEIGLREAEPEVAADACRRAVYSAEGARREELLRVVEFVVGIRLREEGAVGNESGRSAAACASATDTIVAEPDWIGELCATD